MLINCRRPLPRYFFPWLKETLAHRALDHIREDLSDQFVHLPHDVGIRQILDQVFPDRDSVAAAIFAAQASPRHAEWLWTLDVPAIFALADEYAAYARVESACERAVHRLRRRQRDVVQRYYFRAMTQEFIAEVQGVTASTTVRSSHQGALRNLRRDNELFEVLDAVGKVRDLDRREAHPWPRTGRLALRDRPSSRRFAVRLGRGAGPACCTSGRCCGSGRCWRAQRTVVAVSRRTRDAVSVNQEAAARR